MEAEGSGSTTTSALASAVPQADVPVTVYVPAASTVMDAVVVWSFQTKESAPVAVRTVLSPAQMERSPEMLTNGLVATVTVTDPVTELQLFDPVTE